MPVESPIPEAESVEAATPNEADANYARAVASPFIRALLDADEMTPAEVAAAEVAEAKREAKRKARQ